MDTISYFQQVLLYITLWSAPALIVATVFGIGVSLLQALMQLQDQTLPFFVKLIAVSVTITLTGSWVAGQLVIFTKSILDAIPNVGR
ncbi:MAG: type III secretion system export apparatus subunit SctS [Chitinophagaceae bacterium]